MRVPLNLCLYVTWLPPFNITFSQKILKSFYLSLSALLPALVNVLQRDIVCCAAVKCYLFSLNLDHVKHYSRWITLCSRHYVLIKPLRRHISWTRTPGVNEPPQLSAVVTFKAVSLSQGEDEMKWGRMSQQWEFAARWLKVVLKAPFWGQTIKTMLLSSSSKPEPFDAAHTGTLSTASFTRQANENTQIQIWFDTSSYY